jgi:hypothetical protein
MEATQASPDLRKLYEKYLAFSRQAADDRGAKLVERDFESFLRMWSSLDAHVQAKCREHYEKGFARVLQESRQGIAAAIDEFLQPAVPSSNAR